MQRASFGFFRANKSVGLEVQAKLLEFSAQPRPMDESRTVAVADDTRIILRNINQESCGSFLLDFTRTKTGSVMDVSDFSGNEEKVQLPENKMLAEFTVALFDCSTSVLAIHEMPSGVTASMVAKFWQTLIPSVSKFRFDPIFEGRAVDEVMQAGAFSRFSMSLAHMGNEEHLKSLGLSQKEVLDLIKTYSSPNISVIFKIDPQASSRTLAVERIRELTSALLGLGKKHVKKLSLVTEGDDGRDILVNLLKDRILVKEDLTADEKVEVTHEVRYRVARSAWGSRVNELRTRYEGID